MTKEQSDRIDALRLQGKGYKKIAALTGLTTDKVRYYCKKNGMAGVGKSILNADGETCPFCGGSIAQPAKGRKRKFCSDRCRRIWWALHPNALNKSEEALYTSACKCCGKEFTTYGNNRRKYCSRECYIKYRFWT